MQHFDTSMTDELSHLQSSTKANKKLFLSFYPFSKFPTCTKITDEIEWPRSKQFDVVKLGNNIIHLKNEKNHRLTHKMYISKSVCGQSDR